jgi:hypothetical protein
MKSSISLLLVSIAIVGMLNMPCLATAGGVEASVGRISFMGAIVEPTCSASVASIDTVASIATSHNVTPLRFACGTARTATDSSQFYSLTVVDLDAATINHDRVLDYFAGYVKAAGNNMAAAKLVTQTFE